MNTNYSLVYESAQKSSDLTFKTVQKVVFDDVPNSKLSESDVCQSPFHIWVTNTH